MFSEQDVDRELKAALSVSPSPDFEARVLRRVETDRAPHWRGHYAWFAAAASVILVAGGFYMLNRTSPAVAPPARVVEQVPRAGVLGTVREPPVSRPEVQKTTTKPPSVLAARTQRTAPRNALRTPPRTAEPEIIVPLNQMAAVRRLVRAVNEGLVEPPAEPLQGPMPPLEKLTVVPMVVEPIPVPPVAPGAEAPAPSIRSLK